MNLTIGFCSIPCIIFSPQTNCRFQHEDTLQRALIICHGKTGLCFEKNNVTLCKLFTKIAEVCSCFNGVGGVHFRLPVFHLMIMCQSYAGYYILFFRSSLFAVWFKKQKFAISIFSPWNCMTLKEWNLSIWITKMKYLEATCDIHELYSLTLPGEFSIRENHIKQVFGFTTSYHIVWRVMDCSGLWWALPNWISGLEFH